ncbi:MAG: hypothetical protein Q4C17_07670 [Bacillota bacterium]|nr:hypothetical protein [Bacillota bacterium]
MGFLLFPAGRSAQIALVAGTYHEKKSVIDIDGNSVEYSIK